jgi:hypothetical protein
MLAAAERHDSCRNAADAATKRTATDVTPQWNGSAEAARPPGRRPAACQLQCEVSRRHYRRASISGCHGHSLGVRRTQRRFRATRPLEQRVRRTHSKQVERAAALGSWDRTLNLVGVAPHGFE